MKWLTRSIKQGFKTLWPLSLDHAPGMDTLADTVMAWEAALAPLGFADEGFMAPRIAQGFAAIAQTATRWPTPAQLRAAMPVISPETYSTKAWTLEEVAEQRRLDREHWNRMFEFTGLRFRPTHLSTRPGHPKVLV